MNTGRLSRQPGISRLEKCELTWKQNRLDRFKADFPHLDPMIAEQIFQQGYQSGYGRAWRRIGKADQDRAQRTEPR